MFRNAAEIRNDLVHNLLKHNWSAGPRGGYHRRCYLTCTSKRNLKYPLKRIMGYNIKVPVTSKPAKLPRTYDRSKCSICLEDLLIPGTVTPMFDQRRRSFVEESYEKLSPFSREKIGIGLCFLYHKTC